MRTMHRHVAGLVLGCSLLTAPACQQAAPPSPATAAAPAADPPSAPVPPPAASAGPRILRAHVWACDDGSTLHTSTASDADAVILHLPDGDRRLPHVPAASGARYEDASTLFWSRGDEATLQRRPGTPQTCREQRHLSLVADARARGVTFRATGNEPGWLLEIGPADTLVFEDRYGESRRTFTGIRTTTVDGGATSLDGVSGAATIRVKLRQQSCQDNMSGDGFPTTVVVDVDGERREGCGTTLERQR